MFVSSYIRSTTYSRSMISHSSFYSDISRCNSKIMLKLEPVSRCRAANAGRSLVSAAIRSCVSTYCYISCCDAAQSSVYRYFSDSVAAFSPLLYCWVVGIILTTLAASRFN